jgi:hydrophobe/amphiphile efflux-3 (HAE3) family protein
MGERFGGIVRLAARRPLAVLCLVGALALGGAVLALRLEPSADTDTLVNRSSDTFKATEKFKRTFGDEAVVILIKGNLQRTVLTSDLGRVLRLEGCLSGNVPKRGLVQLPPECTEIARFKPAKVVYGPGTFVNTAARQISDEFIKQRNANSAQAALAAQQARRRAAKRGASRAEQRRAAKQASDAVIAQFTQQTLQLALRYGLTGLPSIADPDFVSSLVFDSGAGRVGQPKARFAFLFPSKNAALIQIRMRPDLSNSERRRAIDLFERATHEQTFRPNNGAHYIVTGVPVVAEGLATAVQHSIFVLLAAALLVMAATLALVFRTRLRLLPLALALAAAAMTFGALSVAGGSLTMASIAVLPVLIGLAVDYSIQFQARFDEARSRRPPPEAAGAATATATAGGPTIATAGLATAVGFLVLLLSPVPMVRGFGLLLVLGIVLALGCALTAGFAALVRFAEPRERPADLPPAFPRLRRQVGEWGGTARQSRAAEWLADRSWRALHRSLEEPRRVLAIGLAVAVVGWVVDTQSKVVSDVRELVPANLQALRDVNQLEKATGVSGEIDVAVHARDITDPAVVTWMTRFQQVVLKAHGYKVGAHCSDTRGAPELCPALSLPDLFSSGVGGQASTSVRQLLAAVPPYFSQGVVSRDRRTANMAFGIRFMPLDRQKGVVDDIKRRLKPPRGVQASVVGLPVLAAEANGALSSAWRRDLTLLAALAGVFLVLLAVRRSRREAAVPLIPIALATGWSGALLFLLGLLPGPLEVDLNPMSVTLSALVIAISTEFSVLLSARYRQERERGAGPARAIQLTYASTGAAVLASGATAIAGFAALVASDIRMLRDFGIVTVADLTVSLLGVMVVLPAALLWAEDHGPFRLADLDPRPLARELWEARPGLRLPRPGRRPRLRALRRRSGA